MIKEISAIILFLIAQFPLTAQVDNFKHLANEWQQGKVYPNGKVGAAEANRGGFYYIDIHPDNSVVFKDPVACGFGKQRNGYWTLSEDDTTITFNFVTRTGYMNNPGKAKINEQEVYRIEKLNENELIIRSVGSYKDKFYAFIPAEQKENILFINCPK